MSPEDLRRHLQEMQSGETFSLPYDIFEGIFPPEEDGAHEACAKVARGCGCTVEYDDEAQQIRFAKSA